MYLTGTAHVTDTGEPILLPFRMSCFVLSNLVVTAGMLTPGLGVRHRLSPSLVEPPTDPHLDSRHDSLASRESIPQRSS